MVIVERLQFRRICPVVDDETICDTMIADDRCCVDVVVVFVVFRESESHKIIF